MKYYNFLISQLNQDGLKLYILACGKQKAAAIT